MGLTNKSTGSSLLSQDLTIHKSTPEDKVIALAGNPNVGKSTLFNALTGLNQHTGNWPGKTVASAQGRFTHCNKNYILVDLPGTYSLMANSAEEEVARDFLCFGETDATIIIADATCLERNLNLVLQVLEIKKNVILCINLLDEARKKKIMINLDGLSDFLHIPVLGITARSNEGLDQLKNELYALTFALKTPSKEHFNITYPDAIEEALAIVEPIVRTLVSTDINPRWLSLQLLNLDESLHKALNQHLGFDLLENETLKATLLEAKTCLSDHHLDTNNLRESIVNTIIHLGERIYKDNVSAPKGTYASFDRKIDKLFTSRATGIPIMLLLLAFIFWLTITGANYPSALLADLLFKFEDQLLVWFNYFNVPPILTSLLVTGVYHTLAWIVSVMLPPMAIFFPLFTLMEDSGYLPRIAFNMDKFFKKACAHGKQSLTMCMGFGCNACGVIGCRIIDSPRERLIAILTNNFVPCNGRFPTLITIITMFLIGNNESKFSSIWSALLLLLIIVLGVFLTLVISNILSHTILKGIPSSFALELPSYRRPQIGKVIIRSIFDRTLFVLGRAVSVAAPAGAVIWLLSNITIGDASLLIHCTQFLDPIAHVFGLDGVILMAFILGFPANEIVIPIMMMGYMSTGMLADFSSYSELRNLLVTNGWTVVTAINVMLITLLHFPCATTCLTIKKETKSWKWTLVAFLLPTITGLAICFIFTNVIRLISYFL